MRTYFCKPFAFSSFTDGPDGYQWLFAGLHAVLTDQQVADTQGPAQIEMPLTSQLGRLYPLIEQRQASLRQDLNQIRGEDIESDADGQDPFSASMLCFSSQKKMVWAVSGLVCISREIVAS